MTADTRRPLARPHSFCFAGRHFRIFSVAFLLLLGLVFSGCAEGRLMSSLRGEWEMRLAAPEFLQSAADGRESTQVQTVRLPADLTTASGLSGRAGWITLRKRLPASMDELLLQGVPVTMNVGMASDVYQVYLNETLAGGRGQVDPYEPGYFRTLIVDLPGQAVNPRGQPNFITIAIYTNGVYPVSAYGPLFEVGESKAVYAAYYREEIIVFVLLTIYALIGIYHLLLVIRRPGELYNLYFGLFAIALAAYWFFDTGLRGIIFGDAVIAGMLSEHLLLYNLGPLFILFLSQLFYRRHSRLALAIAAIVSVLSCVALLGTFPVQRTVLVVWQGLSVVMILYVVFYVIRAWRQGRPDAGLLVFGVLLFMTASAHDILDNAQMFQKLAELIPGLPAYRPPAPIASKAFLLVVVGVAGTLANRFARVHTESERLNVELEDRVLARTRELHEAQRETNDILATVQEGLFLLYRASGGVFSTGQQYSGQLETILRSSDIGGHDFVELLTPLLIDASESEKTGNADAAATFDQREPREIVEATIKYLDLMFAGGLSEKMLNKLNPLRDIRLQLPGDQRRDLQFSFYRLQSEATGGDAESPDEAPTNAGTTNQGRQLMAVVIDVTDQKELARKLLAEREKSEAERTRLYAVLRTDPRELAGFIRDCEVELEQSHGAIQQRDRDALFRAVHAMKGDAGMLDLQFFADRAHSCENLIENWNPESLDQSPHRLVDIQTRITELGTILNAIRGDLERMRTFREGFGEDHGDENDLKTLARALQGLAGRMSGRLNKPVELNANEFLQNQEAWQRLALPARGVVKDALVQLLRNSLVHGIESASERESLSKPASGKIELSMRADGENLVISLRDDGRGLNLEGLREKAHKLNRWKAEEIAAWADRDVAALIFVPGLSTVQETDGDAGRGVGMDLVRERIRAVGGRIETRFVPGRYCEFRLRLPLAAA